MRRCSTNGTLGGGGSFLVIRPGGTVLDEPRSEPMVDRENFVFGEVGGILSALACGAEFLVASAGGVRASPGAERIAGGLTLLCAEMTCGTRTAGGVTGLPGKTARTVGAMLG